MGSIDYMFAQLSQPTNPWATSISGFIIVLAVLFLGVMMFGKSKQEPGAFGISILVFIGILISSLLGLFPWTYLVLFLIVALVIILISKLFGGNDG